MKSNKKLYRQPLDFAACQSKNYDNFFGINKNKTAKT